MKTCRATVKRLEEELEGEERKKKTLEKEQKRLNNEKFTNIEMRSSLNSEKDIRKKKKDIEQLEEQIRKLEQEIQSSDHHKLIERKTNIENEYRGIYDSISETIGVIDTMKKQVFGLENELKDKRFKEAAKNYRKHLIQIECNKMAYGDLNKYYTVCLLYTSDAADE